MTPLLVLKNGDRQPFPLRSDRTSSGFTAGEKVVSPHFSEDRQPFPPGTDRTISWFTAAETVSVPILLVVRIAGGDRALATATSLFYARISCDWLNQRLRNGLKVSLWKNHAKLAVAASVIAGRIEHGNVVHRSEDAAERALPRKPHRLARHDGIFFVGSLIEFLNLVPELGFVNGMNPAQTARANAVAS